ncbi:hypothetical protein NDN08_003101 [Rhodosorus marinus]|uniref:Trafficking protein particle complex subunit n=1 Tax=Rhodosorus marinus TaxID=101924 RepID=A0AAV8UZN3_9RHOD|nr:hypothetical protein NDN08_003101 [Rhodosorus marinus]
MIRKFMLISGASGLLLYKTSFEIESSDRIQQPDGRTGLIAGLITALIDFSQKQVQVPFTHMKFEKLALHVVDTMVFVSRSQQQRVICCLESDSEDDERFGRLVASELLFAFVDEYAEKLADMSARAENYEALFEDFSSRIYFIMENLATPIMRDLEEKEGVKYAILLKPSMSEYDYNILSSVWYPSRHPNHTVVLAEVQSFLNVAADISA